MKILVAGDFCPDINLMGEDLIIEETTQKKAAPIADICRQHDISVVNVETVYSKAESAIPKCGPNLKSAPDTLKLLQYMGFTVGACANNHMGDFGEAAVMDTLETLSALGLKTVGAGRNAKEAAETLWLDCKDQKVAIINCCEHEFGIAGKNKAGAAAMDWYDTGKQIEAAKEQADVVIVYLHGGNETNPLPRPGMKKLCRHFVDCGATAVIVAHSHCPQGIETYKNAPIAYGIGNFYFPKKDSQGMWDKGYLASLQVEADGKVMLEPIPYIQNQEDFFVKPLEGQEKEEFMEYLSCISALMNEEETYEKLTLAWCHMVRFLKDEIKNATQDPTFIGTLATRNILTCESHNEAVRTYYKAFCDGQIDDSLLPYKQWIKRLQQGEIIRGLGGEE